MKSFRNSKRRAQSSAKILWKRSKVVTPCLQFDLASVVSPVDLVQNWGLAAGHSAMVSSATWMMRRNSVGHSYLTYRTPIVLFTSTLSAVPILTLMETFVWRRITRLMKWLGMPEFRMTAKRHLRETVSKVLTRLMKSAHVSRLCSLPFCSVRLVL